VIGVTTNLSIDPDAGWQTPSTVAHTARPIPELAFGACGRKSYISYVERYLTGAVLLEKYHSDCGWIHA